MFDPQEFAGGDGKFLSAKWLKTLPKMACKVRIKGGGSKMVDLYDDRNKPEGQRRKRKQAYLTVASSTGLFEGTKEMDLNKTNMDILLAYLGNTPSSWIEREIGVYFDPLVKVGDEVKGGMRVKVLEADPFATVSAPPPAAAPATELADIPF